ncbi:putative leucine-rich repeat domain, L domain-containing protein [Lupinus albus]|uniref:Putative leucine-rich repeat domain, L domain-containing protein n=1 Tax=Lupinus albus TaxID=3870 RepID=A0A6A4QL57_LUPAL|nr:putative leucine-rich repeat domain, L domain-containing protein [Lupinus albus]
MEMKKENESELVRLCIEAACHSKETVDKWRLQRRTLDRLPSPLADALLRRLLTRRLLHPSLLEVFKHSAEEIDLRGYAGVDAEWIAYLGAFRHLRYLNIADSHRITSSALWPLTGMSSLKELDLSRCSKVNDAAIDHIISIANLEKLHISETSVTAKGVKLLASLINLSLLDLGGLPIDDISLTSLQVLNKLQYLDLWGSEISNQGAAVLSTFPKLTYLNLAWTSVTKLPNLSSLECLNMSNCTIDTILEDGKAPLAKLILSGATFLNEEEALLYANTNFLSFLDTANSNLCRFSFLSKMGVIEHLNLSSCMMDDDSIEMVACVGGKLKSLNLSGTKVSSVGLGILAGHVPNLESLTLSQTQVDDTAILFISMMPSLKVVDLSTTNIKGVLHHGRNDLHMMLSLTALQNLKQLERLNLERTHVMDTVLCPLESFQELRYLSLRNASLADITFDYLSSIPKLTNLSICDAVLTNSGLHMFKPPETLKVLDLSGCWLITEDAILSFCRIHPQIEVKHELVPSFPFDQSGLNHSSPSRLTSSPMQAIKKKEHMSVSPHFIDQRLKYSRDELLAMQFMSLPFASSNERSTSAFEKKLE